MNNKIKNYIIQELNKSEKYIYDVFEYLKEMETEKPFDLKLQKAIHTLCEIEEINSNVIISLEVIENNEQL